jgi:hypothetical protein
MRKRWIVPLSVALFGIAAAGSTAQAFKVVPREFDPGKTFLVQAQWLSGIGCPTNATIALPNADFTDVGGFSTYTDPACPTGDSRDKKNKGLLLAKTGPTSNFASAVADIKGVEGKLLTELGYDIRKTGPTILDPRGSHCGAGAPRFNIETTDHFCFLGCTAPLPDNQQDGDGFIRLTWGTSSLPLTAFCTIQPLPGFALVPVTGQVISLQIVFDEGTDASGAPDLFGLAVLDNINVNGFRVGQGPGEGDDDDHDEGDDDGDTPKHCKRCHDDDDD